MKGEFTPDYKGAKERADEILLSLFIKNTFPPDCFDLVEKLASEIAINKPRRRASAYVVLIRYRRRVLYPLYDAERRGMKPSARIKILPFSWIEEHGMKVEDVVH